MDIADQFKPDEKKTVTKLMVWFRRPVENNREIIFGKSYEVADVNKPFEIEGGCLLITQRDSKVVLIPVDTIAYTEYVEGKKDA